MTVQERVEALRATQLFGHASQEALKLLARQAVKRPLRQGEVLFVGGETARGMYAVVSGSLRAFRENPEGREQTVRVERAGSTLAEVPIFDNGPYPSTVMAEEESVVLYLAKDDVREFLRRDPESALVALGILAGRLRRVASLMEQLSLQDVMQRLAAMLLEEAKRARGRVEDGASFSLPDPHQRIAAQLGSVREVITRNLHRLADEKTIAIHGHRITVLNAAALQAKATTTPRSGGHGSGDS
ncbi:MAG: Crp/Fnr family transcriptional regulator [Acidobacteriaceae bacterium]